MSRMRLAIALLAAAAVAAAAVALSTTLSGAGKAALPGGRSPSCLPATLDHSAKLAGLRVYVSPAPQTDTANPHTQISFLGVPAARILQVSVAGARSGDHAGRLRAYSQGDGASFVPDAPFDAGERVTVRAEIAAVSGNASRGKARARRVAFAFRVDTPYPTSQIKPFPNPPAGAGETQSFATMRGVQAPVLTVTVPDRDPAAGDVLTTNGPGPGRYGPLIYTPQGRLVWFEQLSNGLSAENLSVQSYEGRPHLTFWRGRVLSLGFGQGEDVVMDSGYRTVARVAGGNGLPADLHDFQVEPRGIAYVTVFNPIRCDLSPVGGARDGAILDNAVQEIDMRTGLVRWEWHSLDRVGARESETEAPKKAALWDWFHLNSIDPQPGGDVLISARSTWASYELQHGSGAIVWRLGGNRSSFKMERGTETAWQHDARMLPDGELTIFDDGSNPPVHGQSRALRIALDLRAHRALLRAVYTHPSPLLAASQGNAQTLASGNTVVGYGGIPQISEYGSDGALLFDAHLPLDMDSYRAFRFRWSARPLSQPAVVAGLNNTGEETIVHASWNGATEVASWRVLAGGGPASLQARGVIAASGFETETILTRGYAYAQAQALDSSGRVLAVSPPVRVASYAASLRSGDAG